MSFFRDICNECLCRELACEENTNIALATVDGFAYFGLIQKVEDRVVILSPAFGCSGVLVLTPGGAILTEDVAYIDICTIVAKVLGITQCPFPLTTEAAV